ncbi:hypothetical protein JTE90_005050 [Oedothorax gibbosus]|uniref:Carbonic anhydrase n=1 Tax=Oedothorax gibbosus TaxID=931172 RepID=A0AAV6VCW5_9ARAC|nr:hypothetical protein JTE90_005050 [Oedothorax gibbosus]
MSSESPVHWAKAYPPAAGQMQSPVDIRTRVVSQDPQLLQRPLSWTYVPENCKAVLNTGEGWKVLVEGQGSCLTGGPLEHSYQLIQFHCHWGKCCSSGSEHKVDGKAFAGELHLVHWNVDLYNSLEEAIASPKGLAVIGIFFQVGKDDHKELCKITELLHELPRKGDECALTKEVDPSQFIPEVHDYWTYDGSLTTPPCHESVTWLVFKKPVEVSEEQLDKFRCMSSTSSPKAILNGEPVPGKCLQNVRPVQPLNDRIIREAPY